MALLLTVVTLDIDIFLLGIQNLSFGRPGVSWEPFWQLGDSLGDHGAAGIGPEPDF